MKKNINIKEIIYFTKFISFGIYTNSKTIIILKHIPIITKEKIWCLPILNLKVIAHNKEEVIVTMQLNLKLDVVDNTDVFSNSVAIIINSMMSKKEEKYINKIILSQLSSLFNSAFFLPNL